MHLFFSRKIIIIYGIYLFPFFSAFSISQITISNWRKRLESKIEHCFLINFLDLFFTGGNNLSVLHLFHYFFWTNERHKTVMHLEMFDKKWNLSLFMMSSVLLVLLIKSNCCFHFFFSSKYAIIFQRYFINQCHEKPKLSHLSQSDNLNFNLIENLSPICAITIKCK